MPELTSEQLAVMRQFMGPDEIAKLIENMKLANEKDDTDEGFIKRLKNLSGLQQKRDFLKSGCNLLRTINLIMDGELTDDITQPCVHGAISKSEHGKH